MPTLLELFGQPIPPEVTGQSLLGAMRGDNPCRAQEGCIFGQFGAAINFTDGRYAYFLYPQEPFETDLYQYTLMPSHMRTFFEAREFTDAEVVHSLPFAQGFPVWRLPVRKDAKANMTQRYPLLEARTVLFDLATDPDQRVPIIDAPREKRIRAQIAVLFAKNDAPAELYLRYGLDRPGHVA
jgi:hypothetical protein